MANKAQAQAQAQAQEMEALKAQMEAMSTALEAVKAQAEVQAVSSTSNFIKAMISTADTTDLETRQIKVGDKDLTDLTLKTVKVTAQTIINFSKVSRMALCCELAKLDTETAKHDGFKVTPFIEKALPDLSSAQARRYYVVGRIFGDSVTHQWRQPLVPSVPFTNLDIVAKKLVDCSKIETATEKDLQARFDAFWDKYGKNLKCLNGKAEDLKAEIEDILNPPINTTAEETTGEETTGEGAQDGAQGAQGAQAVETDAIAEAREALNVLYTYFRGNDKVLEYLALILAEIPETEAQETETETEAQETETETEAQETEAQETEAQETETETETETEAQETEAQ